MSFFPFYYSAAMMYYKSKAVAYYTVTVLNKECPLSLWDSLDHITIFKPLEQPLVGDWTQLDTPPALPLKTIPTGFNPSYTKES